jgi:hypothetical protein
MKSLVAPSLAQYSSYHTPCNDVSVDTSFVKYDTKHVQGNYSRKGIIQEREIFFDTDL